MTGPETEGVESAMARAECGPLPGMKIQGSGH